MQVNNLEKSKILFVCLGNTCRSPLAEAIFVKLLSDTGQTDKWLVDSAGIANWHVGKDPNPRTLQIMEKYNLLPYSGVSRQIMTNDFIEFDFIIGMDYWNIEDLETLSEGVPDKKAEIFVLREFDPLGRGNIPDPYFVDDMEIFECVYEMCHRSLEVFLTRYTK